MLGRNQLNGSVVCGDPINLFLRGIISSPSCFILGLQARGKSSVAVRMALALVDQGFLFVGASDVKPDLAGLTVEVGGQVIRVAPGVGSINPLDAGPLWRRLAELPEALQRQMRAEIHSRRLNALTGLLELVFKAPLDARQQEPTVLSMAITEAAEHAEAQGRQPIIQDVVDVITAARPAIMAAILVDDETSYRGQVRNLLAGLNALGAHGPFGDVFCRQTSEEMQIDQSVDFDLSAIDETLLDLRAAVQIVCWSYAQAGISAAKTLAEAGLMEERHHLMIMDELWQALRASELLVHQIDGITRLNRTKGLGQLLITHSMKDLQLSTEELTKIATGFMERSSMKVLGGLAQNEMGMLETVFPLSEQEKALLVAWSAEGSVNPKTGRTSPPPGRGRFMLKTGEAPGVPFQTNLTAGELRVHDTNAAWAAAQARVNA